MVLKQSYNHAIKTNGFIGPGDRDQIRSHKMDWWLNAPFSDCLIGYLVDWLTECCLLA